jgi:hypothetical protein
VGPGFSSRPRVPPLIRRSIGLPSQAITKSHQWVVAATIPVPEKDARQGFRRGTVRLPQRVKVDVLETYCEQCRRPWEAVAGKPCEAATGREHLIGGPTGERERRRGEDGEDVEDVAESEFAVV